MRVAGGAALPAPPTEVPDWKVSLLKVINRMT